MKNKLIIAPRFCGPSNSGNGGYVCGRLANHVDYIAEVTLCQPPPLSTEMEVVVEEESLQLIYTNKIVATVRPGTIDFTAPQAPDFDTAIEVSKNYVGFTKHPYPHCFVCGPQRDSPDALCIFPGKTPDGKMIAAPWVPDELLSDGKGYVKNEFIWSALDCPGGLLFLEESNKILLGRMTAHPKHKIGINEKCVVIGWIKGKDGRKFYSGTAIYSETQGLCAVASSIWIDSK